jgi:hypothetical protein
MPALVAIVGSLFLAAGALGAVAFPGAGNARALAPCEAHSNSGEELDLLAQLQSWRDANIPGSYHLTVSTPLNFAAAGYARFLADTPGAGGHAADGGNASRAWADRAILCGYPTNWAAGGEALAVVESSGPVSVSPAQALTIMTAEGGGGARTPANLGSVTTRCAGLAKATSANGHKVAWVVLLFGTTGNCPQSAVGQYLPSPSPSPSVSPSPSPTPVPTATKTPTPTDPRPNRLYVAVVSRDIDPPPPGPTTTTPVRTPNPGAGGAVCGGATAQVTGLNKPGEVVSVTGSGDMTGWYLISMLGDQRFDFPAGYVLSGTVHVYSGLRDSPPPGNTLFWTKEFVWDNVQDDDAYLYDCIGRLVSVFDDGR